MNRDIHKLVFIFVFIYLCLHIPATIKKTSNANLHYTVSFGQWKKRKLQKCKI